MKIENLGEGSSVYTCTYHNYTFCQYHMLRCVLTLSKLFVLSNIGPLLQCYFCYTIPGPGRVVQKPSNSLLSGRVKILLHTDKMLSQKLSRLTLKMSDLKEYEELKKQKEDAERQKNEDAVNMKKRKTPRKVLTFETTPVRSSTPDR